MRGTKVINVNRVLYFISLEVFESGTLSRFGDFHTLHPVLQVTSLPTVNQNVLPPYQTSSSPKSSSSSSTLLHSAPSQDCLDYSSTNDKSVLAGLATSTSAGSGPISGSGSVSGTGSISGSGSPWKYQSFQVL